jgi:hypothetical protein|tara:strand:+ start:142 stop:336 length:195 start_codon:yes stop_codon:yes gene_type:complete
MSQYKVKNYEGYQEILDSVRSIVKRIAPEWAVLPIVQEIDDLETTIDETLAGRADMVDEQNDER